MEHSRKQMRFEILIDRYFSNFPRIIMTNLLFFIPTCAFIALFMLVSKVPDQALVVLMGALLVTLLFPFYAGVVYVCRNMARGDKEIKVFSEFVKGVKDNAKQFLLMGLLFSLVAVFSYFSITLYSTMLSSSWVFYVLLFVCVIITLCVLFILFYAPVMTCTFDLPLRSILRNSFLMSFGEIKNNFKALFSLILVLGVALTATAFAGSVPVLLIIIAVLLSVFLPASCQFVTSFYVYDDMYKSIAHNEIKLDEVKAAIDTEQGKRNRNVETVVEDYSDVDISTLNDTDDYIFYNGKMMKQSVLLKLAKEQQGQALDNKEEN